MASKTGVEVREEVGDQIMWVVVAVVADIVDVSVILMLRQMANGEKCCLEMVVPMKVNLFGNEGVPASRQL